MNPLVLAALLSGAGLLHDVRDTAPPTRDFEITAYTHTGNRMASGVWPREGMVACARRWPFGTQFHVPGVGIVTCTDRGGAIKRGKLDLFLDSKAEAVRWGRRKLRVRILPANTPKRPLSSTERADLGSGAESDAGRGSGVRNDLTRGRPPLKVSIPSGGA